MQTKSVTLRTLRHGDEARLGSEIEAWVQDGWALISHTTTAVPYTLTGRGIKGQDHVLVFQREEASNAPRQGRKVTVTLGKG